MSAEWAIFWAIVVFGLVALDRLRVIADRLASIETGVFALRKEDE